MKQSNWQRAYEQAPASFTGRMETTLAHLKEEEPMKKLSLRIVCIAAAAVLALMGTDMSGAAWPVILCSLVTFALGYFVAMKLGGEPRKD